MAVRAGGVCHEPSSLYHRNNLIGLTCTVDSRYLNFTYLEKHSSRSENLIPAFNMEIKQQITQ